MKNNSVFEQYIDSMQRTEDVTLRWWLQKKQMKKNCFSQEEWSHFINDVTDEVLSRISINVNTSEAVSKIDELRKFIHKLEK